MPSYPSWIRSNQTAFQVDNSNDRFPRSYLYDFSGWRALLNSIFGIDQTGERNARARLNSLLSNNQRGETTANHDGNQYSRASGSLPPLLRGPLEIRHMIYVQNSLVPTGVACRYEHRTSGRGRCCSWRFGEQLTLCDQNRNGLPPPETPFFLPSLGHLNQQIRGEMAGYMLHNTGKIVLYFKYSRSVKISKYFAEFLQAVSDPGDWNAFDMVHELEFPHFGLLPAGPRNPNPDVALMVRCQNLRRINLTLQSPELASISSGNVCRSKTMQEMVDHYGLGPILACRGLEEVHIDWMYFPKRPLHRDYQGRFTSLMNLAVWLRNSFRAQGQEVKVYIPRITNHTRLFTVCLSGGLHANVPSERLQLLEESAHAAYLLR